MVEQLPSLQSFFACGESCGLRSNQGDSFIDIVGDDNPCVLSEVEFSIPVLLVTNGRASPPVSAYDRSNLKLLATRRAEDYGTTGESRVVVPELIDVSRHIVEKLTLDRLRPRGVAYKRGSVASS